MSTEGKIMICSVTTGLGSNSIEVTRVCEKTIRFYNCRQHRFQSAVPRVRHCCFGYILRNVRALGLTEIDFVVHVTFNVP
jgi:hypothetical protein